MPNRIWNPLFLLLAGIGWHTEKRRILNFRVRNAKQSNAIEAHNICKTSENKNRIRHSNIGCGGRRRGRIIRF